MINARSASPFGVSAKLRTALEMAADEVALFITGPDLLAKLAEKCWSVVRAEVVRRTASGTTHGRKGPPCAGFFVYAPVFLASPVKARKMWEFW